MNFKLTISMLILLVGAGIALVIANWRQSTPDKTVDIFLGENPPEVTAWSYCPSGGDPELGAEKSGERWMLTAPLRAVATDKADDIAIELRHLTFTDKFTAEATGARSLAYTGLDMPRTVLKFTAGGAAHKLAIGKRSGDTNSYFVTFDKNDTIYMIKSDPSEQLKSGAENFRNRSILSFSEPEKTIAKIEVTKGNTTTELTPGADRSWTITKPTPARASSTYASAIASALSRMTVANFTSISPSIAGTESPRLKVSATLTGKFEGIAASTPAATTSGPSSTTSAGEKITLSFGKNSSFDNKFVFVGVSGTDEVFIVPIGVFDTLNKSFDELRDRHLIPEEIAIPLATQITLTTDGKSTVIDRVSPPVGAPENGEYTVKIDGNSYEGSPSDIMLVFSAAKNLMASDFPSTGDPASMGLDKPREVIAFKLADGSVHEIHIGNKLEAPTEKAPLKYAASYKGPNGKEQIVTVLDTLLINLRPEATKLRSELVKMFPAEEIASVKVDIAAGKSFAVTKTGEEKWEYASGTTKYAVDRPQVMGFAADFTPLQGRWLRTKADPAIEKGAGDIVVTITTEHEEAVATTSAPATLPAMGPPQATKKIPTTYVLRLYKPQTPATTSPSTTSAPSTAPTNVFEWSAVLETPGDKAAPWVFNAVPTLIRNASTAPFTPPPPTTTTAPATSTAPAM